MGDDGIGLALLRRLMTVVESGDPATVTHCNEDEDIARWQPTCKPGAIDEVAHPGLLQATMIDGVGFLDGGTAGLELVDAIADAEKLLVLDAVTGPGDTGDIVELHGDQLPRLLKTKLSPHQVGLLDLLATTSLLGATPSEVAVVGIVAANAELGVGLDPLVQQALPRATQRAFTLIRKWQAATQ
ncbi:Hydrogenase 2 maturation protease [Corynebacterium choanae]|uniref:Hydrogenase 2 maturation protease n=2 Tax=Corynebacterium choanae TaxID=1862358 RepID=A0A3G6J9A6_9CORY|nr:Hydrogenase 2 maturation protease [Corynebacterium choanae]